MPNFDGTGPEGKGPKTGRQQGKCVSSTTSTQGPDISRPRRRNQRRGRVSSGRAKRF